MNDAVPDCNDGSGTGAWARVTEPSRLLELGAWTVATLTGGGILAILPGSHSQKMVAAGAKLRSVATLGP
jgi:hypothetical protein